MSEPGGFLTRWSRRKLRVEQEEAAPPLPVNGDPDPAPDGAPSAEDTLSPEELAALPSLEDLTPGSDVAAFMRKGVPDVLRRAALRRMWSLDPAVRDYVGDARDYAWDWNVPGSVPGNGPLGPLDDISESVGRMFSSLRSSVEPSALSEVTVPGETADGDNVEVAAGSLEPDSGMSEMLLLDTRSEARPLNDASCIPQMLISAKSEQEGSVEASPRSASLRRHGTAIPKLDLF